jgi:hypothetical protein
MKEDAGIRFKIHSNRSGKGQNMTIKNIADDVISRKRPGEVD